MLEQNSKWLTTMLESIVPWSRREVPGNKVVWVPFGTNTVQKVTALLDHYYQWIKIHYLGLGFE